MSQKLAVPARIRKWIVIDLAHACTLDVLYDFITDLTQEMRELGTAIYASIQ